VKSFKEHLGSFISGEFELVESFNELRGVAMTPKRHRSSWLHSGLHDCLVVFFVMVFSIGEPAILQAGPCEDCEKTKVDDLAACQTDFQRDEKKCVIDAETAQTICINIEQGKIAQAEVDRKSALKTALAAYYVVVGFCLLMPPPANAGCLYGASGGYVVAIGKSERDYNSSVTKAEIEKATCDQNWQEALNGCRKNRDNSLKFCEQKANDKYDRCKASCNGPPQI